MSSPGASEGDLLVRSRSALLDAIEALRDHRDSIIVIGDAAAHRHEQSKALQRTRRFAGGGERNSLSALFVTTPSSLSAGNVDRGFFEVLAEAGRGEFSDHSGRLIESVLLSVLID